MRQPWCYCAEIPQLTAAAQVVILRHVKERTRASNSGLIAHHALPGSLLFDLGAPDSPTPPELGLAGDWLLFPGPVNLPPPGALRRLIVLDGSWSQCRSMFGRLTKLHTMPRLSLPPPTRPPAMRMRTQQREDGMATMEAIAEALDALGDPESAQGLRALYDVMARQHLDQRGGPAALGPAALGPAAGLESAPSSLDADADEDQGGS